jgi:hypothetical protein
LVIALARDFNVFAASIAANLTAILLAVFNLAQARNVSTSVALLIRHGKSSD